MFEKIAVSILTSDWFLAAAVGLAVRWLVSWFMSASGLKWKKYEGWAITAVKAAERLIPDDTPNKGLARMNRAMQIFLAKYKAATGVEPDAQAIAEIENLLAATHEKLEADDTLAPAATNGGGARIGALALLALLGVSLLCGCLTRTRCQQFDMRDCVVNINEPQGIDGAGMPRSIQIGVQDQMVEGGTDSIASGNDTKPSITIPMGDSTLGMIGQLIGGLFTAKPAAAAAGADAAPACTDCAPE
jgi:hypothetical protein